MNVFGNSSKQLMQALTANAENETMICRCFSIQKQWRRYWVSPHRPVMS